MCSNASDRSARAGRRRSASRSAWLALLLIGAMLTVAACNFAVQPATPTPSATYTASPTETPAPTATATAQPTDTLTPSQTPTPTLTLTPTQTLPPTATFTPTATPYPATGLANDQYSTVQAPDVVREGLKGPWFAIASINERTGGTSNPETPQPELELETLYLIDPASGQRVEVMDIPSSAEGRVFWAPDGKKLAYFTDPVLLPDGMRGGGLYLANLELGVSLRLFNMTSLNPRGIPNHRPAWSPDSTRLVIALPTAYDVDLFMVSADGSGFQNLTQHGAFDLWPVWSPDGARLAFVSDRVLCASWVPDEPGSCSQIEPARDEVEPADLLAGEQVSTVTPRSGHLFVMDVASGRVQQVGEVSVDSPPVWVSNLQIAFTRGTSDPLATTTEVWIANVQAGTTRLITGGQAALNLGADWAPGGTQVIYQRASEPAGVVLRDANGTEVAFTDQYLFPRYGFAADWSPGGDWVAFAGRNTQCPYGLVVARRTLEIAYAGTSPRACDPSYSPDGRWLAFAGIQTRTGAADGRLDLYIADANGYGGRNLTSQLRGEIRLLGWVGP